MTYSKDLYQKTCIVTGAAGILCIAMTESLLEMGANVVLLGRTFLKLKKVKDQFIENGFNENSIFVVEADVTDIDSLYKAYDKIKNKWNSPIYLLLNGAGGNHPKATTPAENLTEKTKIEDSFLGLSDEGISFVFNLNYKGTVFPCQVFSKDMISEKTGVILNISSMSSVLPLTKVMAYSSAKSAVNNFTQWLAIHLAPKNIRVNALAPGFFVSEQNRFLLYDKKDGNLTARGKKIIEQTPMNRFGNPQDLKKAVKFLVSNQSSFVTGIVLPVDGGFSAYSGV